MRGRDRGRSSFKSRLVALLYAGAAQLTWATCAHAALGGSYVSVEADRAHLSARRSSSLAGAYSVHALTLANGGVTREFTRPDGTVFAVAWSGPGRPDLRQLLGGYFDTFQADNALRGRRRTRLPLVVNRSGVIVRSGGHPGEFWGHAYLPQMTPQGFSLSELQ